MEPFAGRAYSRARPVVSARAGSLIAHHASIRPRKHPEPASKKPSTANWRTSRARPAPSAPRTAISRLRLSALTSSRLETLTNPIRDRSPAPASSAISVGRISPRIASTSGITVALRSRLEWGYCAAICAGDGYQVRTGCRSRNPFLQPRLPHKGRGTHEGNPHRIHAASSRIPPVLQAQNESRGARHQPQATEAHPA